MIIVIGCEKATFKRKINIKMRLIAQKKCSKKRKSLLFKAFKQSDKLSKILSGKYLR